MDWQKIKCLLGIHPPSKIETHTQGIADEYGYKKCEECGREWGHWDHT